MSTNMSKTATRRLETNNAALDKVTSGEYKIGETHAFARIIKEEGDRVMSIKLADGKDGKAAIKGGLRSGGRGGATRMHRGDIVVVTLPDTSIASTVKVRHIIIAVFPGGRLNKDVIRMTKTGIIPEWLVKLSDVSDVTDIKAAKAEVEEGYEFVADDDDEDGGAAGGAGAGGKKGGGSKAKGAAAADDDISIADI